MTHISALEVFSDINSPHLAKHTIVHLVYGQHNACGSLAVTGYNLGYLLPFENAVSV